MPIGSIFTEKEKALAPQPLMLVTFQFGEDPEPGQPDHRQYLRVCTHDLRASNYSFAYVDPVTGQTLEFEPRITNEDIAATQALSEDGIDMTPSITIRMADPDRYIYRNYEIGGDSPGFKGAKMTVQFIFCDFGETVGGNRVASFSTDYMIAFVGVCSTATIESDEEISVLAVSKMNMKKIMLPTIRIQKRCPWLLPQLDDEFRQVERLDSPFYPCGYDPNNLGGGGGRGNPGPHCNYTKEGCVTLGMYTFDSQGRKTGSFGGFQWDLVDAGLMDWTGHDFLEDHHAEGKNNPNKAKFGDYVPLAYGTGWLDGKVLNVVGDPNSTRFEVLICKGEIEDILKVVVNDTDVPAIRFRDGTRNSGLSDHDATVFGWEAVNWGARQGSPNQDAIYDGKGDPYGNYCVIVVKVPRFVAQSSTTPRVRILIEGGKIPVFTSATGDPQLEGRFYFTNGTEYHEANGNPAWILLDILIRAGWKYKEIDIQSFIDEAKYCEEQIPYTASNGDTAYHSRFSASLAITNRKSVAEVVRAFRMSFNALLLPNVDGKLRLLIKKSIDKQQPNPIVGSNNQNVLLQGGYLAYDFNESNIKRVNGKTTLKVSALPNQQATNKFTVVFQDKENGYQNDSLDLTDREDVNNVGEVNTQLAVEGLNSFDQAQRVLTALSWESLRGNFSGDVKGSMQFTFETTFRVLHLHVGDIVQITYPTLDLPGVLLRILSIQPSTNFESAKIVAAWHEDFWWHDLFGQGKELPPSNWRLNYTKRPPYPWQPDIEASDALDPLQDPTDESFQILQFYQQKADQSQGAFLNVEGYLPISQFAKALRPPKVPLQLQVEIAGGNVEGPTIYYMVLCPLNDQGQFGPPSDLMVARVLDPNNQSKIIIDNVIWDEGTSLGVLFGGTNPNLLTFQGEVGVVKRMEVVAKFNKRLWGAPDILFDKLLIKAKLIIHAGVFGVAVSSASPGTLTVLGADWTPNQWAGRYATVISNADLDGVVPIWNFKVIGNDATNLFVSPDPTTDNIGVETGDILIMRAAPDLVNSDESNIRDAYWFNTLSSFGQPFEIINIDTTRTDGQTEVFFEDGVDLGAPPRTVIITGADSVPVANDRWPTYTITSPNSILIPINSNGYTFDGQSGTIQVQVNGLAPGEEAGRILRVLYGTGAGQTRTIADNTLDTITLQTPLVTKLDDTSIYIVEEAAWRYTKTTTPSPTYKHDSLIDIEFPVDNFVGDTLLVMAATVSPNGVESIERLNPVRECYLVGATTIFIRDLPIRFIVADNPMSVLDDYMDNHYRVRCNKGEWVELLDLSIQAKVAPIGSDAIFDIMLSLDNAATWNTILTSPIHLTAGSRRAQFDVDRLAITKLYRDNLLRFDVKQVGSGVAGGQVETVLKGKVWK
jgi:hypothetical protein